MAGRVGAQTDFDGKLSAVFPASRQFHPDTHRPRMGLLPIVMTLAFMGISKSLWQKLFNRLSDELLATVAEHSEQFCVQVGNLSCVVGKDDANGDRLNEGAKAGVSTFSRF